VHQPRATCSLLPVKNNQHFRDVLQIARDVAEGLAYLHPSVVHRDLKPQNILLETGPDGGAKVGGYVCCQLSLKTCFGLPSEQAVHITGISHRWCGARHALNSCRHEFILKVKTWQS